jgi:hypothetical protein
MSTSSFPTTLDSFTLPTPTTPMDGNGDASLSHAYQHIHISDAVAALQKFIGINNSQDVNSLQYKLANGLAQGPVGPTGPAGTSGLQGPVGPTGPAGVVTTDSYGIGSFLTAIISVSQANMTSEFTMTTPISIGGIYNLGSTFVKGSAYPANTWPAWIMSSSGYSVGCVYGVYYCPNINTTGIVSYVSNYIPGSWKFLAVSGSITVYGADSSGTNYMSSSSITGLFQRVA